MSKDEDLNSHDEDGFTPLYWAIFNDASDKDNNNADETKLLLDKGADPNVKDVKNQRTPLHWAARFGKSHCLKLLLDKNVNINEVDLWGMTPLHLAARDGHEECVKLLLDANADPIAVDNEKRTPLHLAARDGHEECVKLLQFTTVKNKIYKKIMNFGQRSANYTGIAAVVNLTKPKGGGNKKKTAKQFKNNKRTTKRSNKRRLSKSRKNG